MSPFFIYPSFFVYCGNPRPSFVEIVWIPLPLGMSITCQGDSSAVYAPIGSCPNSRYCRAGFTGGLVIDYPNSSKAKKYYLCLSFERGYKTPEPRVAEQQGGAIAKFDVRQLCLVFVWFSLLTVVWRSNVLTISSFSMPNAFIISSNPRVENIGC